MGPTPTLYRHPWIQEDFHVWYSDPISNQSYCTLYYRYPEDPDYGFSVTCYSWSPYELTPVKFTGGPGIPTIRGDVARYVDEDELTRHIDMMYRRGVPMEKAHSILDLELAPF